MHLIDPVLERKLLTFAARFLGRRSKIFLEMPCVSESCLMANKCPQNVFATQEFLPILAQKVGAMCISTVAPWKFNVTVPGRPKMIHRTANEMALRFNSQGFGIVG